LPGPSLSDGPVVVVGGLQVGQKPNGNLLEFARQLLLASQRVVEHPLLGEIALLDGPQPVEGRLVIEGRPLQVALSEPELGDRSRAEEVEPTDARVHVHRLRHPACLGVGQREIALSISEGLSHTNEIALQLDPLFDGGVVGFHCERDLPRDVATGLGGARNVVFRHLTGLGVRGCRYRRKHG
jgi:hypothetical protein